MTYQDGLVVKFLPSLEILQIRSDNARKYKQKVVDIAHEKPDKSRIEARRIITKRGTVIRYMKDKSIQILMANGNYSVFNPKTNAWIKTKNDGTRKQYKMNPLTSKTKSITEIEPLTVEHKIDPETNVNVTIRSDKVMQIFYNDSTLTMHHDDTIILSKNDGTENIL